MENKEDNTLPPIMYAKIKLDAEVVTVAYMSQNGLNVVHNQVSIKQTAGNYITIGDDYSN